MVEDTATGPVKLPELRAPGNRWFWLSILFDALLFIATSTYAYIAYHQWKVMNSQVSLMSQQMESTRRSIEQTQEMLGYARQQTIASSMQTDIAKESERPYIVTKDLSLRNVSANASPSYVFVFENSGRTTARQLSVKVVIEFRTVVLPENPTYPEAPGVNSVFDLGAGAQAQISGSKKSALTQSDIAALKQGNAWLYVYGIGQYLDGHGQRHVMKFCSWYDAVTKSVSYCAQHNSSN